MEIIKNKFNYLWLAFAIISFINLIVLCIQTKENNIIPPIITFVCLLSIIGILIALFLLTRKTAPLAFFYIIHASFLLTFAMLVMFGSEMFGGYYYMLLYAALVAGVAAGIINIVWAIMVRKKVRNWIPNLIIGIVLFLSTPVAFVAMVVIDDLINNMNTYAIFPVAAFVAWGIVMFVRGILASKSDAKKVTEQQESDGSKAATK